MDEARWRYRRAVHEARVHRWITPHLQRHSRGEAHPVEDFLFTYYSYRPSALRRWLPGLGVELVGDVRDFASVKGYVVERGRAKLDSAAVDERRGAIERIRTLLEATRDSTRFLGCFGLHEWAMVYRQSPPQHRHADYPLRLGAQRTDEVVESHRLACTHFDAFRFFTPTARPLNAVQLARRTQARHDQPGCLHATMDLYKWAYKLAPLTSSDLVADCFALARDVRELDMRASPYDLGSLGYAPVRIETSEGKQEYVAAQRAFAERAAPLRQRLLDVCELAAT